MTAKEFLSNKGYGTGTNFTVGTVASLMEEYADQFKQKESGLIHIIRTDIYGDVITHNTDEYICDACKYASLSSTSEPCFTVCGKTLLGSERYKK